MSVLDKSSGVRTEIWQPQPAAAKLIEKIVAHICQLLPAVSQLKSDLLDKTGTRLIDWIDTLSVPADASFGTDSMRKQLKENGFRPGSSEAENMLLHPRGIFPAIRCVDDDRWSIAIKVEDVASFLVAHRIDSVVEGKPLAALRRAKIWENDRADCWIIERHGDRGWEAADTDGQLSAFILEHREALLLRTRSNSGFDAAKKLLSNAIADLGVDRTCDLFFSTEREYWQSRNRAAQIQKLRQNRLGMGWANHDHHTYRSSRECFAELISILKLLGFHCRERFYAGEQAGWGAQVLEQPTCGIVIFADVDLLPGEVEGDFASDGLPPEKNLGTVGLWCKLHGEAFLQAGMHHLECQFDFDAARQQLAEWGIESMAPFTDMPHLKQAFTKPEIWQVDASRNKAALAAGYIDKQQAAKFSKEGAVGSHLEILERNDGYKGFNQSGISHIIKETDPRTQ